jgi:hypothetical protein
LTGYILAGIVGGGAFGLVGWRIILRWHWKGFAGFLLFWAVYALVHDFGGSQLFASSNLRLFGSEPVPILANVFWNVTGNALPPLTVWLLGNLLVSISNRQSALYSQSISLTILKLDTLGIYGYK